MAGVPFREEGGLPAVPSAHARSIAISGRPSKISGLGQGRHFVRRPAGPQCIAIDCDYRTKIATDYGNFPLIAIVDFLLKIHVVLSISCKFRVLDENLEIAIVHSCAV